MMQCVCHIVPKDVLTRLANDKKLSAELRKSAADSAAMSTAVRNVREQAGLLTGIARGQGAQFAELAAAPLVSVYDCHQTQTLPGLPQAKPASAKDATVKRAFAETTRVATFYKTVFKRNSIDDAGMTLVSSVHYGKKYNNAMWNGTQMLYGDGDAQLFADFTKGNDVIGHELTHGVTQHSLQLAYANDAGGLNESLSDCFGSMFRQWEAQQTAAQADWLIGKDILGTTALARGYTCLRNMADPADKKALAPQPTQYAQITPGMDPHYSSGPPNLAFTAACKKIGGYSWETIGQVWYQVMTGSGAHPTMKIPEFANRTRQVAAQLFARNPAVGQAIDLGWKQIGV